jgi:ribose/xylose/arabinose/galactoside ABC-type transport system permease subunit
MELQAIASAVIGGVALTGGIGSIWGAVIGALMLSMISNGLVMMGAPAYWFITFVGIVLVLGVLGNNALMGWARRRYFK